MPSRILTGARCLLYINGELFAQAMELETDSASPHKEIGGIGTLQIQEVAPTGRAITGSISYWRVGGDGGTEGLGVTAPAQYLARLRYFNLDIYDRTDKRFIFRARGCRVTGSTAKLAARTQVIGSFSFHGITDETEATFGA